MAFPAQLSYTSVATALATPRTTSAQNEGKRRYSVVFRPSVRARYQR